ncbi:hypothetical protein D3C71_76980 [compost metagenome]
MKLNGLRWTTHPQHKRWSNFVQRCYNEKNPSYKTYGGVGIGIDQPWHPENPQGFDNFCQWLEEELNKKPELKSDGAAFEVVRKDVTKNYGPGNCKLEPKGSGAHNRTTSVLSVETVAEMRRRKRNTPLTSLTDFERETGVSAATISRALRGATWCAVNPLEPPLDTLDADVLLSRLSQSS